MRYILIFPGDSAPDTPLTSMTVCAVSSSATGLETLRSNIDAALTDLAASDGGSSFIEPTIVPCLNDDIAVGQSVTVSGSIYAREA